MSKEWKNTVKKAQVGSVILILLGIVLLVNPDFGSIAVAKMLGWGLVAVAAICLLAGVLTWPVMGFATLAGSIVGLMLGVYILNNPLALASLLGWILGIFLVVQGLGSIGEALRLCHHGSAWRFSMVVSILTLGLGVVLIFAPLTTSRLVMIVAGVVMIVCGAGNLITHVRAARCIDRGEKQGNIIDAEE